MRSGTLRQRVVIQSRTLTDDQQGGQVETWAVRAVVPADVRPLNGREALLAQQVTAVLSTAVTMRYRNDVSVTDRIVWNGRTLQIGSVQDPDGKKDELHVLCSEVQS